MAMKIKVGSFAAKTVTGNQVVRGLGFIPKAIIFFVNENAASGTDSGIADVCIGVAVSSSSRMSLSYSNTNGLGTAGRQVNTKCLSLNNNGTVDLAADLVSLDSSGFTINWTTAPGTAYLINFIALGGTDLGNVFLKQLQAPASTGNQSYTGVGFQPDAIMLLSAGSATAPDTNTGATCLSMGFAISSAARATSSLASGKRRQLTNKALTVINSAGTLTAEADLVSLDVDGFTLNWTTTLTNMYTWVLCLQGGQYKVGSINQQTSTGNQSTTGAGFQPTGAIFMGFNNITSASTISGNGRLTFGAGTAVDPGISIFSGDDGDTASADDFLTTAFITGAYTEGVNPPTVKAQAKLTSFDSDGFTLNWTTADATAREFIYFAFGSNIGGSMGFTQNKLRPRAFAPGLVR